MIFELNKSYIWIFAIFCPIFLVSGMIIFPFSGNNSFRIGVCELIVMIGFILFSEIRSGIAIDSWWRAVYPKGTWQYQGVIAWQSFGILAFSILAVWGGP